MNSLRASAIVTLLACIGASDEFAAGVDAWRAGRFADAFAAFAAAEKRAGDAASPELLFDLSLAALRAGDLDAATSAARRTAKRGGRPFESLAVFVEGNVAYARAERAAAVASQPEAEPFAFDAALAHARTARDLWRRAAAARADWPEATRNLARAEAQIAALERAKAEAERRREQNRRTREAAPQPKPAPAPSPETTPEAAAPRPQADDGPDALRRVLARLGVKEREKRELRKSERVVRAVDVERDW